MKINSDFVWAVILVALASASFFLGIRKGSLATENELEEKLKEIVVLENKNQQLSEELESRGVFSYPQATVVSKQQDSAAMVLITLNGKDPIQNLRLSRNIIYNYSEFNSSEVASQGRLTNLGTLRPHNPAAFDIPLQEQEVALYLQFESDSKLWHQYIRIKKSKAGRIKSVWVITNQNSVIIDKHIDEDFPTDPEGKIVFWEDQIIVYSRLELNSLFPENI